MKKLCIQSLTELCIILLIAVCAMSMISCEKQQENIFSLSDYQFFLDNFSYSGTVERISDEETAIEKAEEVWLGVFGGNIIEKKPYVAYYDAETDTWLVKGTLPDNSFGGVPYAIIQSDGQVLAVWHDK